MALRLVAHVVLAKKLIQDRYTHIYVGNCINVYRVAHSNLSERISKVIGHANNHIEKGKDMIRMFCYFLYIDCCDLLDEKE